MSFQFNNSDCLAVCRLVSFPDPQYGTLHTGVWGVICVKFHRHSVQAQLATMWAQSANMRAQDEGTECQHEGTTSMHNMRAQHPCTT